MTMPALFRKHHMQDLGSITCKRCRNDMRRQCSCGVMCHYMRPSGFCHSGQMVLVGKGGSDCCGQPLFFNVIVDRVFGMPQWPKSFDVLPVDDRDGAAGRSLVVAEAVPTEPFRRPYEPGTGA